MKHEINFLTEKDKVYSMRQTGTKNGCPIMETDILITVQGRNLTEKQKESISKIISGSLNKDYSHVKKNTRKIPRKVSFDGFVEYIRETYDEIDHNEIFLGFSNINDECIEETKSLFKEYADSIKPGWKSLADLDVDIP